MKSKIVLLAIVLLTLLSCSKDEVTEENDVSFKDNSISLNIDGNSWETAAPAQGVYAVGFLSLSGSDSNGKRIDLTLVNPEPGKVYDTGGLANNLITGRWTAGTNENDLYTTINMSSVSGEIKVITFTDSLVQGTFNFKAANSLLEEISITEGKFSVNIE